jgi:hypothetical protein
MKHFVCLALNSVIALGLNTGDVSAPPTIRIRRLILTVRCL